MNSSHSGAIVTSEPGLAHLILILPIRGKRSKKNSQIKSVPSTHCFYNVIITWSHKHVAPHCIHPRFDSTKLMGFLYKIQRTKLLYFTYRCPFLWTVVCDIFCSLFVLRVWSYVDDFNNSKLFLTAKLLKQGDRYHKIRKAFSKFYHRHTALIFKYKISLKTPATGHIRAYIYSL